MSPATPPTETLRNEPDLALEAGLATAGAAHIRGEFAQVLIDAWHVGRTKVGLAICAAIIALAVFGPFFAPASPTEFVAPPFAAPSADALLGSDYIGHDVLTRVLYGGRTVITLALAATVIGLIAGVVLGLIAGYARRWADETIMRLLDVVLAFPSIVLAMLFVSVFGPRLWLIVLMVGFSHAPRIARVTRVAALEIAQRDFVRAAEALGVARRKILFAEILPNITSPLLVEFGLRLTYSIGIIAALSFLGFGMQPPAADWGLMINENRIGITVQPYAVLVPVILIGILTVGTNLVADGLGRALVGIDRDTGGAA
ncbi:MAG TPA: ABC transporter permease [Solirubrobacterales bacterium]|nr:ABC transporter permease [Solirubrobacterales bacterium]